METKSLPENKYLGVLCKSGHDYEGTGKSLRYEKHTKLCVVCSRKAKRKYELANPGLKEALIKRWKKNNPEKVKLTRKNYYRKNMEGAKEYAKKYRLANVEGNKKRAKKYRESCTDSYIRTLLGLTKKEASAELIEIKKLQLQIYREIEDQKGGV